MNLVKVKRLHPHAIIPQRQTAGAACFDIHALHSSEVLAGDAITFHTGLAFEIPEGWVLKVYPRSGLAAKHRVRLGNCTGIIDSDYRGQLMIILENAGKKTFSVTAGDRIAQAMLERVEPVEFVVVDDLSETERGEGGLGSTDVPKLKAYQVGDDDIYAAYDAKQALEIVNYLYDSLDPQFTMEDVSEVPAETLDKAIPEYDDTEKPTGRMTTMRTFLTTMKEPGWMAGRE